MYKYFRLFFFFILPFSTVSAQSLKPGFEKQEFIELLKIGARTSTDSSYYNKLPAPQQSKLIYQSQNVGFDNLWQLWTTKDNVPVISIRGTTKTAVSFMANLYAAMVPAKGELELEKDFTFDYNLSNNPRAAVHVGFLVATAYLSRDILPRIDSCYKAGSKEFIITGHSQGGAITYLLTSLFESLKTENRLPKDIRFKTCAMASPKPGNLFYAYDFENLTKNGWSYNAVNSVDWVPELPFSIQTLNDLNETNPFINAKKLIKKQKFPLNIVIRSAYNQLSRPAKKAQRKYEKWLGTRFAKIVRKNLREFNSPHYYNSNNYVRTGTTILLVPDSSYYVAFPEIKDSIWHNHTQKPYLFLAEKLPGNGDGATLPASPATLDGYWQLDQFQGSKNSFATLFPNKKPLLSFISAKNEINIYSRCGAYNGRFTFSVNKINLIAPNTGVKECTFEGEQVFLATLKSVNGYSLNEMGLSFTADDVVVMHFSKMDK
ncbi:MAG: META domain-containing protein [Ferruginibacter sp.]